MSKQILSVTRLVHYLKMKLESDPLTRKVMVEGEISNFSNYRSGHWYFSLKDENAVIRCAMFSTHNRKINFIPKDGDKVIVQGDISVFEARGDMQLLVTGMRNSSIGELYLQFEELKRKLNEEGLFSNDHKKSIPKYPMNIALITGSNTAARADVLSTLEARWPIAKIVEYPVLVQGKESAAQIIEAMNKADLNQHDVILLVRGGGSIEDLWSFNDEQLARTIYQINTPVVTGVGHEINFTIADFVADLRAPTPTGAAVQATPDIREVLDVIYSYRETILHQMESIVEDYTEILNRCKNSRVFQTPEMLYREKMLRLDHAESEFNRLINIRMHNSELRLQSQSVKVIHAITKQISECRLQIERSKQQMIYAINYRVNEAETSLNRKVELLDAYSPLKVLRRGYAIAKKNELTLKSVMDVSDGDKIQVHLSDGIIEAEIEKIIVEE